MASQDADLRIFTPKPRDCRCDLRYSRPKRRTAHMTTPAPNPLLELRTLGESVWLDDISRGMLEDGSLASLVNDDGVAGLTSNPAIFANSIMTDPEVRAADREALAERELRAWRCTRSSHSRTCTMRRPLLRPAAV